MKRRKKIFAWILLIGSCVAWPLCALTVASEEPQFVLGLSFLAIILSALDALWIVDEDDE